MFSDITNRIHFDPDRHVAECDLSLLAFDTPATVALFFMQIEDAIAASGLDRWYFIVNLQGTRITPEAMPAFTRRVQAINSRHALGTVRYASSPDICALLDDVSRAAGFRFKHVPDRLTAQSHVESMRKHPTPLPEERRTYRFHDLFPRFGFDTNRRVLDMDLSHLTLHHGRDTRDLFDHIRARIQAMGAPTRWFFLIDYTGFRVEHAAWIDYTRIGRQVGRDHALGLARYGASPDLLQNLTDRVLRKHFTIVNCDSRDHAREQLRRISLQDG